MVKFLVMMSKDEGKTCSNVISFEIPAITRFNGDVEHVLESLSELRTKVIKPSKLETEREEVKLTLKMLGLICVGTATQTLQEATKAARRSINGTGAHPLKASIDVADAIVHLKKVPAKMKIITDQLESRTNTGEDAQDQGHILMTVIEVSDDTDTKRNKNHVANAQGHKRNTRRRKKTLDQT